MGDDVNDVYDEIGLKKVNHVNLVNFDIGDGELAELLSSYDPFIIGNNKFSFVESDLFDESQTKECSNCLTPISVTFKSVNVKKMEEIKKKLNEFVNGKHVEVLLSFKNAMTSLKILEFINFIFEKAKSQNDLTNVFEILQTVLRYLRQPYKKIEKDKMFFTQTTQTFLNELAASVIDFILTNIHNDIVVVVVFYELLQTPGCSDVIEKMTHKIIVNNRTVLQLAKLVFLMTIKSFYWKEEENHTLFLSIKDYTKLFDLFFSVTSHETPNGEIEKSIIQVMCDALEKYSEVLYLQNYICLGICRKYSRFVQNEFFSYESKSELFGRVFQVFLRNQKWYKFVSNLGDAQFWGGRVVEMLIGDSVSGRVVGKFRFRMMLERSQVHTVFRIPEGCFIIELLEKIVCVLEQQQSAEFCVFEKGKIALLLLYVISKNKDYGDPKVRHQIVQLIRKCVEKRNIKDFDEYLIELSRRKIFDVSVGKDMWKRIESDGFVKSVYRMNYCKTLLSSLKSDDNVLGLLLITFYHVSESWFYTEITERENMMNLYVISSLLKADKCRDDTSTWLQYLKQELNHEKKKLIENIPFLRTSQKNIKALSGFFENTDIHPNDTWMHQVYQFILSGYATIYLKETFNDINEWKKSSLVENVLLSLVRYQFMKSFVLISFQYIDHFMSQSIDVNQIKKVMCDVIEMILDPNQNTMSWYIPKRVVNFIFDEESQKRRNMSCFASMIESQIITAHRTELGKLWVEVFIDEMQNTDKSQRSQIELLGQHVDKIILALLITDFKETFYWTNGIWKERDFVKSTTFGRAKYALDFFHYVNCLEKNELSDDMINQICGDLRECGTTQHLGVEKNFMQLGVLYCVQHLNESTDFAEVAELEELIKKSRRDGWKEMIEIIEKCKEGKGKETLFRMYNVPNYVEVQNIMQREVYDIAVFFSAGFDREEAQKEIEKSWVGDVMFYEEKRWRCESSTTRKMEDEKYEVKEKMFDENVFCFDKEESFDKVKNDFDQVLMTKEGTVDDILKFFDVIKETHKCEKCGYLNEISNVKIGDIDLFIGDLLKTQTDLTSTKVNVLRELCEFFYSMIKYNRVRESESQVKQFKELISEKYKKADGVDKLFYVSILGMIDFSCSFEGAQVMTFSIDESSKYYFNPLVFDGKNLKFLVSEIRREKKDYESIIEWERWIRRMSDSEVVAMVLYLLRNGVENSTQGLQSMIHRVWYSVIEEIISYCVSTNNDMCVGVVNVEWDRNERVQTFCLKAKEKVIIRKDVLERSFVLIESYILRGANYVIKMQELLLLFGKIGYLLLNTTYSPRYTKCFLTVLQMTRNLSDNEFEKITKPMAMSICDVTVIKCVFDAQLQMSKREQMYNFLKCIYISPNTKIAVMNLGYLLDKDVSEGSASLFISLLKNSWEGVDFTLVLRVEKAIFYSNEIVDHSVLFRLKSLIGDDVKVKQILVNQIKNGFKNETSHVQVLSKCPKVKEENFETFISFVFDTFNVVEFCEEHNIFINDVIVFVCDVVTTLANTLAFPSGILRVILEKYNTAAKLLQITQRMENIKALNGIFSLLSSNNTYLVNDFERQIKECCREVPREWYPNNLKIFDV
ncbi:hypothetical protein EIN_372310 [Entamoeba invadens IP1]|uniref:Uncharacterized protein n=1 Tax=Entamoeba invadens IP1 TaxID=370355 RepID=A0A0A1UFN9_ENTIV|nr:hypothetical protein EIN_372310 [Entamoeba invadens IP1]ELP92809.1 hypothetical protein EIN_372310 [Entamoeba invadens IP1]|eukprot:XP_004259580.1 hypothetical protein EIN_372310 [Entamoeba invadens IP1]